MTLAFSRRPVFLTPFIQSLFSQPLFPRLSLAIPSAIHINLPTLLPDIWESILRAVPKKKTSYSKKRSRLLAGKALKDVTALVKCPACGQPKRAHLLCTSCVESVRRNLWERATEMVERTNRAAFKAENPPKPIQAFRKSWTSSWNTKGWETPKKGDVETKQGAGN